MKKLFIAILITGFWAVGCATTDRYNTQQGAAIGAGLGALAGQAIGHDTRSTLIGTGVGTLLGSIIGNGVDQQEDEYRSRSRYYENDNHEYGNNGNYDSRYYGEETTCNRQPPPGRWVMVPGHWEGRRWIPSHDVWMPVDPR
jgi:hypothetical protein